MTKQEEILVRHLIAMIQADGVINPEETGVFAKFLGQLELEGEDVALAGTWLTQPQKSDLEALKKAFKSAEEREAVSSLLLELAQADSLVGHHEIKMLSEIAQALEIS